MDELSAKVVLLGSGAVGKTSLVRQFVEQRFDDDYITTIGVNIKKKMLPEFGLKLIVWDIYGQKLSSRLHASNYTGANGAIVVCDLTRRSTFDDIDHWIQDLFAAVGRVPVIVLGNKVDIIKDYESGRDHSDFHQFMLQNHSEIVNYYRKVYNEVPTFERIPQDVMRRWLSMKNHAVGQDLPFYKTSAKTGENVEDAFKKLGEMILDSDAI